MIAYQRDVSYVPFLEMSLHFWYENSMLVIKDVLNASGLLWLMVFSMGHYVTGYISYCLHLNVILVQDPMELSDNRVWDIVFDQYQESWNWGISLVDYFLQWTSRKFGVTFEEREKSKPKAQAQLPLVVEKRAVLLVGKKGGVEEYESHVRMIVESLKDEKMYVKFSNNVKAGAKRKLSRCGRNQMGNEPILALPEGADDFVVYYDARSKDLEACLEKGEGDCLLTNRWLSMKKDIASCGSKYLAYSEVEVEYQGSSGLLLQPELWVVEGLTLERCSTFGKKDKLEPSYVGTFEIFGYIGPTFLFDELRVLMPRVVKSRDEIFSRWGYCDNHDLSRLDNQSIERDRLIGIGFVLNFVKFISFTFGDKEMISVIEAVEVDHLRDALSVIFGLSLNSRKMPPRRLKKKSIKRLVEKRVAKAIEEYEKSRANLDRDDIEAYNNRFHELALMYLKRVPTEMKKIEKYVRGFPERIKGTITSSKPVTLHDAINMASELVEQAVQGCGEKGHFKDKCPKGRNQPNEGAHRRAYVVVENPILFDSGAEKSFISSAFTPFIDIAPTALNTSYEVELADGKVIVRIPLPNGEILEVQGERPEKEPGSLACIKADEKKLDDIREYPRLP
ncbi:hypothetical protein Tco_1215766 [Tanacetum coccineum]